MSVATGHNEYWPVYLSIGNIRNRFRRAHCNGVVLLAFLAIPKSRFCIWPYHYFLTRVCHVASYEYGNDRGLRKFRRQLLHSSLAKILESLRPGMTTPEVVRFPDSHFRKVIYGLGPYIADYPEQVLLTGIVQTWCPKYVFFCAGLISDRQVFSDVLPPPAASTPVNMCAARSHIPNYYVKSLNLEHYGMSMDWSGTSKFARLLTLIPHNLLIYFI